MVCYLLVKFLFIVRFHFIIISCSHQCLVRSTELDFISSKVKRDERTVLLTGTNQGDIILFDLKKASKRTPSGKDIREEPPLAASGSCRNRNRPPPWSRPPICRLGRLPHVTEVTSGTLFINNVQAGWNRGIRIRISPLNLQG